jgi:class 3 adenylate cyclase
MAASNGVRRPPAFGVARVIVPGIVIYMLFSTLFGFFFVFTDEVKRELGQTKDIVIDFRDHSEASIRIDGSEVVVRGGAAIPALPSRARARLGALVVEVVAVALGLCAAFAYHRPLILYFSGRRRGRPVPERIISAAKARIPRSPPMMAAATAIPIVAELGIRLATASVSRTEAIMIPIEVAILALSTLFTYLWQRHRIQVCYLSRLFSADELASSLPAGHEFPVRRNFLLVVTLATFLPLALVVLFVGTSVRTIGPLAGLSPDQRQLLFGEGGSPLPSISVEGLEPRRASGLRLDEMPVPLIAPLDTLRIVVGLALGLGIVLVYVFFIARWTATDIALPLELLRANMLRVEAGDLGAITPATTANEIGELTVGFNSMLKGIVERGRIKELFGQYLTKEISEAIIDGRVNLDGARYEATVMFTDIRGFTAMSENLEPEEIFAFLNDYLGRMIEVIAARRGIIDKFLGDGILAVFGLPVPSSTHADDAFAAAMDMRVALAAMNAERLAEGRAAVRIGIGMHTGDVIAGNVGSAKKLQFTVIGDTVNLASRIEGMNKDYGSYLLISGATYERLGPAFRSAPFERIGGALVRGKSEGVDLYRLLGDE